MKGMENAGQLNDLQSSFSRSSILPFHLQLLVSLCITFILIAKLSIALFWEKTLGLLFP